MSTDYEKLKALLFKDELDDLSAIRQLLNDNEALAQRLSEILDKSNELTLKNNPEFQNKFISTHPEPYLKALKLDPQGLTTLLTPIISPAIKSAVLQSMRRFVDEINQRLELGFSLKWRWQAFKTDVKFSEIVFENTIQYQVQQLLLIDKETGLLVEYAGLEEELAQDKDAMSSMFTAIQDFVSDSLTSDSGTLSSAEFGDNILWAFPGQTYNLAVLIKGAPTARLNSRFEALLTQIHNKFGNELSIESNWNNHLPTQQLMAEHLLQKSLKAEKKSKTWPWILILLVLASWIGYTAISRYLKINSMTAKLENISGLVVDDIELSSGKFIVSGLKDPLADTSDLEQVTFETQTYYSLDEPLISQRVEQLVYDSGIDFTLQSGILTLKGRKKPTTNFYLSHLRLLPGITQVIDNTQKLEPDNSALTNTDSQPQLIKPNTSNQTDQNLLSDDLYDLPTKLQQFIKKHPLPDQLELSILQNDLQNELQVSGTVKHQNWLAYLPLIQAHFDSHTINTLQVIPPREALVDLINNNPIKISNPSKLSANNISQLNQVIEWDHLLTTHYQIGKLILHGRSDCQGSIEESLANNKSRLAMVRNFLLQSGVKSLQTEPVIETCEAIADQVNQHKIGVWFEKQ